MAAPSYVTDGTPVFGTATITINGTDYVAEDINIDRPTMDAEDYTRLGLPNRKRWTAGRATGTMTLQAPSGTSGRPVFGGTFTMTVDDNYGSETWVVMPPSYVADNQPTNLRKMPVRIEKAVGVIASVA